MPTHGPAANSTDPTNCTTPVFCEPLEGVTITLSPMMIHDGIGTSWWTIQRNRQHWAHKTQEGDEQSTKPKTKKVHR